MSPATKRIFALPGIRLEIEWLPRLAPHLPVPTPVPRWTGMTGEPPWPFWGARHLPGDELARRPEVDRGSVEPETQLRAQVFAGLAGIAS